MNKQKKTTLIKISLLFTFLLFLSCNDDLYNNHEHNHGENKNKISLSQFKSETKIKDFKTIIKSNIQAMKSTNRNAELSDFVIDTLAIQRHISQNSKTTYSFKIYPLSNISLSNESYNLVYRLENNNWEQSIFLIKTNSNFELSEINHLYDSFLENNSVNQRGVTACISTTPVTYCTGQSACADRCDATTSGGCPTGECYRYVITTIGDCSTGGGGSSDPNNGNPSDNSQSGYLPTNPYEFTPNMFDNPVYDDPNYVNAIKAQHFFSNLSYAQQVWANENVENYNQLIQYRINNNWSNESEQFVEELIELARQDAVTDNNAFNFVLQAQIHDKIENDLDEAFLESVNQYVELNTADPIITQQLITYFSVQCVIKRHQLSQQPGWNNLHPWTQDAKVYWAASKELVHVGLDIFGLVPLIGELADLTNGVLYTIEGDGVNATLSYASAIPLAGWVTASTKIGLKVINVAGETTELVWKVVGNVIEFGDRRQLRKVLGITDSSIHAHHLIPWSTQSKTVVQKAAKSENAFHLNEALNGIPLNSTSHLTGHAQYTLRIETILNSLHSTNQNMSPQQAYNHIISLTNQIRTHILNHPNYNLGQIANLIVYP